MCCCWRGSRGTRGVDALSGITLELLSEDPAIAAADVLRTPMLVTIKTLDGTANGTSTD